MTKTVRTQRCCRYTFLCPIKPAVPFLTPPPPTQKCCFPRQEEIQLLQFPDHQFIKLTSMKSAERKDRRSQANLYQFYRRLHVAGFVKSHRAKQNTQRKNLRTTHYTWHFQMVQNPASQPKADNTHDWIVNEGEINPRTGLDRSGGLQ